MTTARYLVYARDKDRRNLGEIADYSQLVFQPRFNDVGGWHLTAPATSRAARLITKTGGIIITRNNLDGAGPQVVFSGQVTSYNPDSATLEVAGASDEQALVDRAASPDPTTVGPPDGPAYALEQDLRTGTASTIMLAYVKFNAVSGFAATSASGRNRVVPGLAIGPDLGLGSIVYGQARWISLLALMQDLALAGGATLAVRSLRFQVLQSSTAAGPITFSVSQPVDRSGTVVISRARGTLGEWKRTVNRPSANVVYTLGNGQGVNRLVIAGVDTAAVAEYGYEIDGIDDRRDVSDTVALVQANATALVDSGEEAVVTFTPIDTPAMTWGVEYDLGDLISVVTPNAATGVDETLTEIVRGVDVTLTIPGSGGNAMPTVRPIVSTPGDTADDPTSRQQRAVTRRVSNLERNVDSLASALTVQWNIGDLRQTTRTLAAAGWLICQGQAVSRTTYSALFSVIGTTYGAGNGTTTFNVPDFRDRVAIGAGSTYVLGATGGAATVDSSHQHTAGTLTVPNHSHAAGTLTVPNHQHAAGSLVMPSHNHAASGVGGTLTVPNHAHAAGTLAGPSHTHTGPSHTHAATGLSGPSHSHSGPSHTHASTGLTASGAVTGPPSAEQPTGSATATLTHAVQGHTHTAGAITMGGSTAADGTGSTGFSGTGAVTGSTAADGTGATGTSGTGSVTGSTATDGTTGVTGSTANTTAAVTGTTATDGTTTATGSTATDGTTAATGATATGGSTTLSIVQPYVAVNVEIYAGV